MPSITIWHRLEPRPQESDLPRGPKKLVPDPLLRGLQARVRDPLWLLARQWQVGELAADDAGSPITATIAVESIPLESYRPLLVGPATGLNPKRPLEAQVERETVVLGLRGAVQLGLHFEALLRELEPQLGAAAIERLMADFRTEYPVDPQPP